MTVTLEQFIEYLSEVGFMTVEEVHDFLDELPLNKQPRSARRLVEEMVGHGRLTKFQAELMFKGKIKRLVIGNYIILEKIGQGGMGRVYRARHRRMDRIVALKLLPFSARESPEAIDRFELEVKAAARLSHPNIVTAHDADEAGGRYFLVMEYIDGVDLLTLVKERGPLPVDTAVDYVLQASAGLAYAHSQKVIHLDIKPANLLLDKSGTIKILDMGLARIDDLVSDIESAPAEELIQNGKVMGTVDYVPPERSSNPEAVDHRADIYSLGCTFYHLLTGRPPFSGSTILKRIRAHRVNPIPSLCKRREDVPESLDAVYQRMLAKDPDDRYQSMEEVITHLRASVDLPGRQPEDSDSPENATSEGTVDASDARAAESPP
ncbi:MAG TPA: serine/threonine-protein kinase [Thermoguttaceae bacterium]|nr:serine/threonine-protein kinase [Thermoguttaceae bacterium]